MKWHESRVVVTGGAGFIGGHLCESLLQKGARVTVLDDLSTGSFGNLEALGNRIEMVQCKLGDRQTSGVKLPPADVIFHLAGVADPRKCKEDFDLGFRANVLAVQDLLSACTNEVRFIHMSSAAVYGDPDYVPIDENHPFKGNDPYAISKILGEWVCKQHSLNSGVRLSIIRPFNAFGPRQSPGYLIPTLIRQAIQENKLEIWNADPIRDYLYVADAVEALIAVAASERAVGMALNLGGGKGISAGTLASHIADLFNIPYSSLGKAVTGSAKLISDVTRIKELTGWQPQIGFEEGIRRTIDYFRTVV